MGAQVFPKYVERSLHQLFVHETENSMAYGVTSPGTVNMDYVIDSMNPVHDVGTNMWRFRCNVPHHFTDWWMHSDSSSEGLGESHHVLGKIRTSPAGSSEWEIDVDKDFADPETGLRYGTYRLVRGALMNSEGAFRVFVGPVDADGDHDVPIAKDTVYTYRVDCDGPMAAHIKACEREHVDDFGLAYDLLFRNFAAAANAVPPQPSQDALWKQLWNRLLAGPNTYLHGTIPGDPASFNDVDAWKSQLAFFFHQLCDLSQNVRDIGAHATHHPIRSLVVWAAGAAWEADCKVGGQIRHFRVEQDQCNVSVLEWMKNPPTSQEVVNERTASTTPACKRILHPLP